MKEILRSQAMKFSLKVWIMFGLLLPPLLNTMIFIMDFFSNTQNSYPSFWQVIFLVSEAFMILVLTFPGFLILLGTVFYLNRKGISKQKIKRFIYALILVPIGFFFLGLFRTENYSDRIVGATAYGLSAFMLYFIILKTNLHPYRYSKMKSDDSILDDEWKEDIK